MTSPCENDSQAAALKTAGELRAALAEMGANDTDVDKTVNAYWFFVCERKMNPCEASEFVVDQLEKSYKDHNTRVEHERQKNQWQRTECL